MSVTSEPLLEFTGERMIPADAQVADCTFWEHIYRYKFALDYVKGKRVLDIACGEGYGTAALARAGASTVIGVDISEETCQHARHLYGLDARVGDAEAIPLPDSSVDVVVSFETVEHVPNPERFFEECVRILTPGGIAIFSTPNKELYRTEEGGNPYHCSEMTEEEFTTLLNNYFGSHAMFMQMVDDIDKSSPISLASQNNPWITTRGMNRLRDFLRYRVCRHVFTSVTDDQRKRPVDLILKRDNPLHHLVNWYAVQRFQAKHHPRPQYFVAVAYKKK